MGLEARGNTEEEFMNRFRSICLKSIKEHGGIKYDGGDRFIRVITDENKQVADSIIQWEDGTYHFDFEEKPKKKQPVSFNKSFGKVIPFPGGNIVDPKINISNVIALANSIDYEINNKGESFTSQNVKLVTASFLYLVGLLKDHQLFTIIDNDFEEGYLREIISCIRREITINPGIESLIERVGKSLVEKIIDWYGKDSNVALSLSNILNYYTGDNQQHQEPIIEQPLQFDQPVMNNNFNYNLKDIEKSFGKLLKNFQYQFNQINEMVELITNLGNGQYGRYLIDPGFIIGNGYNIMGNTPANIPIYVNIKKHKEIVKNILDDPCYIMTPEEVQIATGDMFLNQFIYNVVDMSNMRKHIGQMNYETFSKLGKKLTYITNIPEISLNGNYCRLRFLKYININSFIMVSDEKCIITGSSASIIVKGLKITCNGDDILVESPAGNLEYHIDSYGVM